MAFASLIGYGRLAKAGRFCTAAYRDGVDQEENPGGSVETQCSSCGSPIRERPSQQERAQNFQILVACAQCGNEFAAISRN